MGPSISETKEEEKTLVSHINMTERPGASRAGYSCVNLRLLLLELLKVQFHTAERHLLARDTAFLGSFCFYTMPLC